MIAARVKHIEASGIRKMFELGATLKDPVDLSIGQADFETPPALKAAAIKAIEEGWNRYSMTQGLPELNRRIVERWEAAHGRRPEASMVTCGVSGGVLLSFLCLLEPGDEILLPDPFFMMYRHLALLCDAVPRYYSLYPDFRLPLREMEGLLSERTKVILINSPANPTGAVFGEEELRAVGAMADRVGAVLISDEIYDEFVYDAPFVSPCRYSDRSLVLGGFSKTYGIAGWRLGFALGPEELIDQMRTVQQFTYVCAPTPLQKAILDTWGLDMSAFIEAYRRKRAILVDGLSGLFRLAPPAGSFYAFPALPEGVDAAAFVKQAIAREVLIVPGSAFSRQNTHFRVSFATTDEKLERGTDLLRSIAVSLQGASRSVSA